MVSKNRKQFNNIIACALGNVENIKCSEVWLNCIVRGVISEVQYFQLNQSLVCAAFSIEKVRCSVHRWLSQTNTFSNVVCVIEYRSWKLFIGLSQKHCAWLGFANAKSWTESISYMVRRLVSQVESSQPNSQVYWALMNVASEKKFNCQMLWWLSQVSTVQWQDSLQKSRVSCVEECQTESIVICVDDWPSANMLSVIVYCFTAQSVDNGFEINQHELQNLLKIYQK